MRIEDRLAASCQPANQRASAIFSVGHDQMVCVLAAPAQSRARDAVPFDGAVLGLRVQLQVDGLDLLGLTTSKGRRHAPSQSTGWPGELTNRRVYTPSTAYSLDGDALPSRWTIHLQTSPAAPRRCPPILRQLPSSIDTSDPAAKQSSSWNDEIASGGQKIRSENNEQKSVQTCLDQDLW